MSRLRESHRKGIWVWAWTWVWWLNILQASLLPPKLILRKDLVEGSLAGAGGECKGRDYEQGLGVVDGGRSGH